VQVPLDARITLTVSDGPEQREVPNVAGKSAVEATSELVSAGFKVTESNEFSGSVPQGQVIATDPVAGTLLDKDAVVTIRVSQGLEQVVVPRVVGLSESEASSRLTTAGFKVSVEDQLLDDPDSTEDGQVLAQNPNGDTRAPKGSTVIIIVGQAPDVIPPDPIN
jgi:serine/threonine-protein kinase